MADARASGCAIRADLAASDGTFDEYKIARLTSEPQSEPSQPQEIVEVRTSLAISGARITTNSADLPVTERAAFRDAPSPRPDN